MTPTGRQGRFFMANIYILEAAENSVTVLYGDRKVQLPARLELSYDFEQVADLTMEDKACDRHPPEKGDGARGGTGSV